MIKENGGRIDSDNYFFEIHPFFDKSDRKKISRTCNHIGLETKNTRKWNCNWKWRFWKFNILTFL